MSVFETARGIALEREGGIDVDGAAKATRRTEDENMPRPGYEM